MDNKFDSMPVQEKSVGETALQKAMARCSISNNPVTRYTVDAIAEKLERDGKKFIEAPCYIGEKVFIKGPQLAKSANGRIYELKETEVFEATVCSITINDDQSVWVEVIEERELQNHPSLRYGRCQKYQVGTSAFTSRPKTDE